MQQNKLYVGNLPWSMNNDSLQELFAQFGEVTEAIIIMDRNTNRSKGFGFVTFSDDASAQRAIEAMAETEIEGRKIVVNVAKPREERSNSDRSFNKRRTY